MKLTLREYRGFETLQRFYEKDIEKNLEEFKVFLDTLIELQQYMVSNKIKLPAYKIHMDTLIAKSILHSNTIYFNLKGVPLKCQKIGLDAKVFDIPSLHVVLKAQLENLLMMEFIYFLPNVEIEIEFNYKNWIYAELLARKNIPANSPEKEKIKESDKKQIVNLENFLKSSPVFMRITKKQRRTILEKGMRDSLTLGLI